MAGRRGEGPYGRRDRPLDRAALADALAARPRWRLADEDKAIARTIRFPDFASAFAFMARIAIAAERMDHHPDWSNSHRRVDVRLTTHSAGGVTARDLALADLIDAATPPLALDAGDD